MSNKDEDEFRKTINIHFNNIFEIRPPPEDNASEEDLIKYTKSIASDISDYLSWTDSDFDMTGKLNQINMPFIKSIIDKPTLYIDIVCGLFKLNKKVEDDRVKCYSIINAEGGLNFSEGSYSHSKNKLLQWLYISYTLWRDEDYEEPGDPPEFGDVCEGTPLNYEGGDTFTITKDIYDKVMSVNNYTVQNCSVTHWEGAKKQKKTVKDKKSLDQLLSVKHTYFNIAIHSATKSKYFDMIYDDLWGHLPPSNHKIKLRKKFMEDNPLQLEDEGAKKDFQLHAFISIFNKEVSRIIRH